LGFEGESSLSSALGRTGFSVTAAHQLYAWELPQYLWIDTAFASAARPIIDRKTTVEVDSGWLHVTGYSSYFYLVRVGRTVARNVDFIASYGHFGAVGQQFDSVHAVGMLMWHPPASTLPRFLSKFGINMR
jgi:hypothetical protein